MNYSIFSVFKKYKIFTIYILICIFLILFTILPISYCNYSDYIWSQPDITLPTNSSLNEANNNDDDDITLESESAILIEQNSGKILFEKNSHEQLRPASVTKIMTILLIMEDLDNGKISLTDKVPCGKNAADMRRFTNMA